MKLFGMMLVGCSCLLCTHAYERNVPVTAQQRYPWSQIVDLTVTYDLADVSKSSRLTLSAYDTISQAEYPIRTLTHGGGVFTNGAVISKMTNTKDRKISFQWDAGKDLASDFSGLLTTSAVVKAVIQFDEPYMVIDLSGGTNAMKYTISYLDAVPSGGWTDEHKMNNLVLRYIPAGMFTMGSPTGELGRSSDETQHEVMLTKGFWMGVFEVTVKQYELVTGTRGEYSSYSAGDAGPVNRVSYDTIRGGLLGANWPSSSVVDAGSFMGRIRAITGVDAFDLPTEAQWEYACRAGTTTALNSGNNLTNTYSDANLNELGWYQAHNQNWRTSIVGLCLPNAWGLYDMHGNVAEWCLDWAGSYESSIVTNPVGPISGSARRLRGGAYSRCFQAYQCRSAARASDRSYQRYCTNNGNHYCYGFRLCCPVDEIETSEGVPFRLDLRTGTRQTHGMENIRWSGLWDGDANSIVRVVVGDQIGITNKTGDGSFTWNENQPGVYALTHVTYQDGKAIKRLTAKFELPEVCDFFETELRAVGYEGVYDGAAHTITVTAPDAMVTYARTPEGPFVAENPEFSDIVSTSVWYRVEREGFNTVTASVPVVITPANILLTASQRYPWNGLVDIDCSVVVDAIDNTLLTVEAVDAASGENLPVKTLSVDGGKVQNGKIVIKTGFPRITWDAETDVGEEFFSKNVMVKVSAEHAINSLTCARGEMTGLALDLHLSPRMRTHQSEILRYDACWAGDTNATLTIKVDGEVWATGLKNSGMTEWDSTLAGIHTLELQTYQGTELVDTQTATFIESGLTTRGTPFEWLDEQWLTLGDGLTRADYEEAAAGDLDEDGYAEWQEYLMGTDPWDETSTGDDDADGDGFTRWEEFIVGTKPDDGASAGLTALVEIVDEKPRISWTPDLNEGGTYSKRLYTVWESESVNGPWTVVEGAAGSEGVVPELLFRTRFYKVTVELVP